MRCPDAIAEVLIAILRTAILQIRMAGWSNDPDRCAKLADHVHNIPALLLDYSPDRLRFYWECERPAFIDDADESMTFRFEDEWELFQILACASCIKHTPAVLQQAQTGADVAGGQKQRQVNVQGAAWFAPVAERHCAPDRVLDAALL